ncbi:hypothetical protein CLOBOL_05162 [Enterocloster bolteae ATCC BAA-613]|uniref:Uncharacterized protein n=1 Tax=Enterocloster bolteae (strain ATCC BAA-613 / DSM 15670 / CCUG 46953 / JCM 12243 / WAL 16351) TaxID=411902 RepID=A8RYL6_ENTBW|nr:hypothetical protein CLOBOL_05162 [Enterocloster bolteae ATCC BAA-613]
MVVSSLTIIADRGHEYNIGKKIHYQPCSFGESMEKTDYRHTADGPSFASRQFD